MKKNEGERRGWILVAVLLLTGFLCVILAGNLAIRFAPRWTLNADMGSRLDPDSDYLLSGPRFIVPPLDPAILTQPVWINVFLTPGAAVPTRVPVLSTQTPQLTPTQVPGTNAPASATITPTSTFLFFTPTKHATSNPTLTKTSTSTTTVGILPVTATRTATATTVSTATRTFTPTATPTTTKTGTPTATPTATGTSTVTATATGTPTNPPIYTDPLPEQIGLNPDGNTYNLPAGGSLTLPFNITANGHSGYDMVYYELPMGSGILLDWVTVEISDGRNWYTVFNWGDNYADSNTNMDFNNLSYPIMAPFPPPEEPDQRDILNSELYNSTGIAIDLDSVVSPGDYYYIRFSCPTSVGGVPDTDGKMEIDAIQPYYP